MSIILHNINKILSNTEEDNRKREKTGEGKTDDMIFDRFKAVY